MVVDRIVVRGDIATRLADSFQTALELADGIAIAELAEAPPPATSPSPSVDGKRRTSRARAAGKRDDGDASPPAPCGGGPRRRRGRERRYGLRWRHKRGDIDNPNRIVFSEKFACPVSGFTIPEIEPRLFSFNNPYGACPVCDGLGAERTVDAALVVPDDTLSLRENAIAPWGTSSPYYLQTLEALARHYKFLTERPGGSCP